MNFKDFLHSYFLQSFFNIRGEKNDDLEKLEENWFRKKRKGNATPFNSHSSFPYANSTSLHSHFISMSRLRI